MNICKRSTDGAFLRAGPDKTHSAQADESGVARFAVSGGLGASVGEDALCVASGLVWQTSAYTGLVGMLPGQVVELQVPTMGSLRVEVKDSKGDPWNSGCYVYVQAAQGEKWRRYAFGEREGAHWVHGLHWFLVPSKRWFVVACYGRMGSLQRMLKEPARSEISGQGPTARHFCLPGGEGEDCEISLLARLQRG